jgi:uncharacterized protein YcbX
VNTSDLDRLRVMTLTPERTAMSRAQQFPSMAAQHIANEQEIVRLRSALNEAVVALDAYKGIEEDLRNLLVWAELFFISSGNHENDDVLDRLDVVFRYRP